METSVRYLAGILHSIGISGDHGTRCSKKVKSWSSMCLGISVSKNFRYSYGFKLFSFAVSTKL